MSTPPAAVVAIDGGNSKTDLALVAADGSLLAMDRGPGMPPKLSQVNVDVIAGLLRDAAATAGAGPSLSGIATATVACVANVDLPEDERQLERMLAAEGWTPTTRVANDTFAVLRAGLDDVPVAGASQLWGVGVTCGAGINCAGLAPDGRTAGFLALGQITGDRGGGYSLGFDAQWHAIRAEDGRGPDTVLRRLVPAHFGLSEPSDLAVAVHQGKVGLGRFGELAPLVLSASDEGDEVARALVLQLAEEISLMVIAVVKRLDLASEPVPVILGGGVLAANNPLLISETTARIVAGVRGCTVRVVEAAPVAGAALLGLDAIGAPVEAMARLRSSFGLNQEHDKSAIR
ncbi:MAG TPA: BadF/BadG/BcrA/BcrD ATPase family protein [Streptosporangiaceae bacterium]|nr:BadF/BadG/BcrA/BcrD ATPase family protein [Streptosporangiaceae bacterium]